MGQVNLLKINAQGLPAEMAAADEITLTSFTVTGVNGPVLSIAGLDMNSQNISDSGDITFNAVTNTIAGIQNQNLVDKTAAESITGAWDFSGGEFTFPSAPSAVPAEGDSYWSDASNKLFVYDADSATWIDISKASEALAIDIPYTVAPVAGVTAGDAVYVSADDSVDLAIADGTSKAYAIGFAVETKAQGASVDVREKGIITGVLVGASAGSHYFLSAATAGDLTNSPPTASGKDVVQMGVARNATDLDIAIQYIGKRA